mgnify:CR=1 FL=1
MNQNVMDWRNEKGMPEIEKIIADSYGERYVGKCNNTTFVIKCGTTGDNNIPFYAHIRIQMKDTYGYSKDGFDYHEASLSSKYCYPYNGEAHVEEWENYLKRKQAEEKGKQRRKLKSMLKALPADMKQELLTALLSELKGE